MTAVMGICVGAAEVIDDSSDAYTVCVDAQEAIDDSSDGYMCRRTGSY